MPIRIEILIEEQVVDGVPGLVVKADLIEGAKPSPREVRWHNWVVGALRVLAESDARGRKEARIFERQLPEEGSAG